MRPSEDDGRYEVVALPGRSLAGCQADPGRYRVGVGADGHQGAPDIRTRHRRPREPLPCRGRGQPRPQGRVGDAGPPGRSRPIADDPRRRPRGPADRRDEGDRLDRSVPVDRIPRTIADDRGPRPRPVEAPARDVRHDGRKLVGSVYLKGDEAGPVDRPAPAAGARSSAGSSTRMAGPAAACPLSTRGDFFGNRPPARASCRGVAPARRSRSAATADSASRASSRASSTGRRRSRGPCSRAMSSAT